MSPADPLVFRLFGELELRRGEQLLELPPSKKTRALLAYLVLTQRAHRRDHLCKLFWDVTDDPRGALRWSLSKLRGLVDTDGAPRLIADREHVRLMCSDARVDALELRAALTRHAAPDLPTDQLESIANAQRGELLEGLDLPDFDDFQAWCVAQREETRALRTAVLCELVTRHADTPARALDFARSWIQFDALSEPARAALVRLLGALGRFDEARQHYESALRLDAELGRKPSGELEAAFRTLRSAPPVVAQPAEGAQRDSAVSVVGPAREAPFVGRARERALLDAALKRTRAQGRLELLVVSGEPGVGKTRLLTSYCRSLSSSGARVLYGAAFEAESGHPYGPWIDVLRGVEIGRIAPGPLLDLVHGTAGEEERQDGRGRERLFGAVADAVGMLATSATGMVLVFDDVQWLDEGSAELLHYVVRMNRHRPLFIVLLARAGELADNVALSRMLRGLRREGILGEHVLGPLEQEEALALVRSIDPHTDAMRVAVQSRGNPLFALELARAELDQESVPESLSGLLRDRLSQLPSDVADVLRWAAVLGCGFSFEPIAALTSLSQEALINALELLEQRVVLRRTEERTAEAKYEFVHEIVRRVVYTDLSEPRRRLMHRRVAQMLRAHPGSAAESVADVAHHASLAQDSALAAETCLAAARRSLRLFANADAYALARRGMRHAERLELGPRVCHTIDLLEVSFAARRPQDVEQATKQVEELAERALDLGNLQHARRAFHLLSYLHFETGGGADARKHMLQAEAVSRGASEQERVVALAEAARCLALLERDLGHAQALALEASARARHADFESSVVSDALGMLKLHQGNHDEAERELERARALAHVARARHDEFQALEHLTMLEVERSHFAKALERAEELSALAEKMRDGSELPFARTLVSLCKLALSPQETRPELEAEMAALRLADAKYRLLYVLTRLALLESSAEQWTSAHQHAGRALELAEVLERPSELVLTRAVLLRCARARAEPEALRVARESLATLTLVGVSAFARKLAEQELGADPQHQEKQQNDDGHRGA